MDEKYEKIIRFEEAPTPESTEALARELDFSYACVRMTYLGSSLRGRGIPLLTFGEDENAPAVLYIAAHHASEWICTSVLLRFAYEFASAASAGRTLYGVNTASLLASRRILTVPMLNPDGVALQQSGICESDVMAQRLLKINGTADFTHWQANGRGVDLNHNYDAGFAEYKKVEQALGISSYAPTRYSGEFPESEPEVALLCSRIRYDGNVAAAISLHTQGEEIYCSSRENRRREHAARRQRSHVLRDTKSKSPRGPHPTAA